MQARGDFTALVGGLAEIETKFLSRARRCAIDGSRKNESASSAS